jgi:hypothetical protein
MSEQKPSHKVKLIVDRTQRQDCVEPHICGMVLKHFCIIEGPQEHSALIPKWKKFGTTKTLPRAGRPGQTEQSGRRALVKEVTKNPMVTDRVPEFLDGDGEPSRRRTISAALHQSGLYDSGQMEATPQ